METLGYVALGSASSGVQGDVPGYRLVRELGNGGSARVWSAVELLTGQRVALKFFDVDARCMVGLTPERAKKVQAQMQERFEREATIAAGFCGIPGFLQVHGLRSTADGRPFLVMELLDAREGWESLERRMETWQQLPQEEALAIAEQVAATLGVLHSAGIEHRDLKPANVMVRGYDEHVEVKLLDYGIALDHSLPRLTESGAAPGTPQYLSPTALQGQEDPGRDVYALGVMLFEALTGRLPHEGATLHKLLVAKMMKEPPPLRVLRPDVSDALAELVDGLLSLRIGSVADLVEELFRLHSMGTTSATYRAA